MGYYPLMLDVSRYRVVVVGGGSEAEWKIRSLLEAEALLTVVAPEVSPALAQTLDSYRTPWHRRLAVAEDFDGARLVFAASDDQADNRRVATLAREHGAWVNTPDDLPFCDVVATSHFRRGPLLISVFSGGHAPGVAKVLRQGLEAFIGDQWPQLIERVATLRRELRQAPTTQAHRRQQLGAFVARHMPPLFRKTGFDPGSVHLVGAGPGNIDTLTIAALKSLSQADVVLFDRLVHPSVMDVVPARARRIDVGKVPGQPSPTQAEIHRQIIDWARQGHRVIRLHGGDPFVFGRAGEEMVALRAAGIACKVIPGLSSALAAPAMANIPVTLRHVSDQVAIVSARTTDGPAHWDWLPSFSGTVVILMGMANLEQVVRDLSASGRGADVPAAVIAWAGWEQETTLHAPLGQLVQAVRNKNLAAPAVIVVGEVVGMTESEPVNPGTLHPESPGPSSLP